MNQSCTINISRATAMLAVPNICAKVYNPVTMTFFWDKTINPGKFHSFSHLQTCSRDTWPFFGDSVFSYTIHSAQPIKGMHESCNCFAVVPKGWKCNLVRAAATNSIRGIMCENPMGLWHPCPLCRRPCSALKIPLWYKNRVQYQSLNIDHTQTQTLLLPRNIIMTKQWQLATK